MMMKKVLTFILVLLQAVACGQVKGKGTENLDNEAYLTTPEDMVLAERVMEELAPHAAEGTAELMVRTAEMLIGQQYVAGTLDEQSREQLCLYLTRIDCILFVESCLGLARTVHSGGDFEAYADEIRHLRYRDGKTDAYADRLHYTTEWARQGVARGVLQDVTKELGGVPFDHPVSYMSAHPDAYPRMSEADLAAIREVERSINASPSLYIPKNSLTRALKGIRSGDILCFTSRIEGLDIAHVGIAVVQDGTVGFIHASTGAMEVVLEPKPLGDYLQGKKGMTGLQVYRPR